MIDFIIDTNDYFIESKYKIIIDRIMMRYNIDYNKLTLKERKTISNFQVYIIEISKDKHINSILQDIRFLQDDWQSMIIIISDDSKYKNEIINSNLLVLDYIERNNSSLKRLEEDIIICLKHYKQRYNTLKYTYKNNFYSINLDQIFWIEKEQNSKRCLIKTENSTYYIQDTLQNIYNKLPKNFLKCNKSFVVNMEKVLNYNKKDNIITFKNKIKFNNISQNKKKEIIKYFL